MAAQFKRTKVRSRRGLRLWMARAISSLPVPVSPCSNTVEPVGATMATWSKTLRSAALLPTMSSKLYSDLISDSRYKRSSSRRAADAFRRPCASALSNASDIWMPICDRRSRSSCPKASTFRLPIASKPNGLLSVANETNG